MSIAPKVSIVIPVYNGSDYLRNAIDCALAQTYANVEVIVVNDGSTDNGTTEEIALSYGEKIKYFYKSNGGVSSALNFGINQMSGEYFSWLSHDDAYETTKIENSIALLERTGQLNTSTIAYLGGYYIDENGSYLKPFSSGLKVDVVYSGYDMVCHTIEHRTLNGCCMLIPKSAFEKCGGFDENLRYSQDALMWYKMFLNGFSLVFDSTPSVMYRLHRTQTSRTRHDLFEKDAAYIAGILAPQLAELNDTKFDVLYAYTCKMAKHRCKDAVRILKEKASEKDRFSFFQKLKLAILLTAGAGRDYVKKIYYRCILKIKV